MNFTIEKTKQSAARGYIMDNHYTGGCAVGSMTWGLFDGDDLGGAIAFHTPISENVRKSIFGDGECWCDKVSEGHGFHQHVTELHRLATDDDLPQTATSWFVSESLDRLKEYKPKYWAVLSFADSTEGHDGTVYQACNAKYIGMSGERTYYRAPDGTLKPPRNGIEGNITVDEAEERGWETEKRKAKHRYLFTLPDGKRHKRWIDNNLQFDVQEYPMSSDEPATAD